jgi:hypothetical protein
MWFYKEVRSPKYYVYLPELIVNLARIKEFFLEATIEVLEIFSLSLVSEEKKPCKFGASGGI